MADTDSTSKIRANYKLPKSPLHQNIGGNRAPRSPGEPIGVKEIDSENQPYEKISDIYDDMDIF